MVIGSKIKGFHIRILLQIAAHLDSPAPSVAKFAHEPSTNLTCSEKTPLKNLSCVSWRWRKIVLPILFRYSRIPLDPNPQWVPIDARIIDNMQGQLTKLSNHELQVYQHMRSKFKSSGSSAYEESFDDLLINLCRIDDGDNFLKSVPHILWFPHLPRTGFTQFSRFVQQYTLKHHIKNVVVYADRNYELRHVSTADAHLAKVVQEIWTQIFELLEPTRIVVAAPPSTLAGLLDAQMLSADTWAFDMKMHYVEFAQQEQSLQKIQHTGPKCRPWNAALVHRRPWNHLAYNEGSSISAYSTYEYHLKQSPRMLYLILLRLAKEASDCCNIRSFSFTGVFPFHTNTTVVIRALQKIRTLRQVTFQLAPGPENDLLNAPKRMGRAQPSDLWLEWNGCYKIMTGFLGAYEFADGARFVSKDCSVEAVKQDVGEYMELLQKKGLGWTADGEGVWVRDCSRDREVPSTAVPPPDL
ncbi:hypothetical protein DM02DRAFT_717381 [Periconia macrospinosa]|uniref:F-box domain-containing protein n=1 Tax=Periconia macrospinosa TaxID=97972 RepID=A0A2V1DWC7_9PLEO|nr:hypothetical protein DM02DRAFT_717381 [Periconia macrospinosa]